jgi:hypothetical protein
MSDVLIYLAAASAMWDYYPDVARGGEWADDASGQRVCERGSACAAEIVNAQCELSRQAM